MEIPGAGYFYALAQLGITFSGFAALLIVLRQARGSGLSQFHLWVAQSYVKSGLVTSVNAMLAPLIFGLGIPLAITWQVVSGIVAIQSLILLAMAPIEWRKVSNRPLLPRVKVQILMGCLINCALLLNASGWPFPPRGGLIMLAISANLFAFFAQFAESLRFFFDEDRDEFTSEKAAPARAAAGLRPT
jgi:hypothetical protein